MPRFGQALGAVKKELGKRWLMGKFCLLFSFFHLTLSPFFTVGGPQ